MNTQLDDSDTDFDFDPPPAPFVIAGTWKFVSGVSPDEVTLLAQEMKNGEFKEGYRDVFVGGTEQPIITFVCFTNPSPHQPDAYIHSMCKKIEKRFVDCKLGWHIVGPVEMIKHTN